MVAAAVSALTVARVMHEPIRWVVCDPGFSTRVDVIGM